MASLFLPFSRGVCSQRRARVGRIPVVLDFETDRDSPASTQMPYPMPPPPLASSESLIEIEFTFSGVPPCPSRPPLSAQSSYSASSCISHSSRRSYRPTLTPGDFLVHAYGSAAVHDTLLDLRQLSCTSSSSTSSTTSTTPETENDFEDEVEPATDDAQRESRSRKKKKLLRYRYPKPPPKGTFCSAAARLQSEDANPLWPLPLIVEPPKESALKVKTPPSTMKKETGINILELVVEKKLDEVAEKRQEEGRAMRSFERSELRRQCSGSPYEGNGKTSSREPPMSPDEWRVKTEERLELRKLRRVKFALEGVDLNLKSSLPSPLPLDIDCRPNTSSFGLLETTQSEVPRVRRKRERTVSAGPGVLTRGSGGDDQNADQENGAHVSKEEARLGRPKSLTAIDKLVTCCASLQIDPLKLGRSG